MYRGRRVLVLSHIYDDDHTTILNLMDFIEQILSMTSLYSASCVSHTTTHHHHHQSTTTGGGGGGGGGGGKVRVMFRFYGFH